MPKNNHMSRIIKVRVFNDANENIGMASLGIMCNAYDLDPVTVAYYLGKHKAYAMGNGFRLELRDHD